MVPSPPVVSELWHASHMDPSKVFKLFGVYIYKLDQGCGGLVNLTEGRRTITSLDLNGDGNYEPELNCQWTLAAPPGKVVKLRFTQFQLEMRQNDTHQECWDYLEIRNGDGPFAQKVDSKIGTTE